MLPQKSIDDYRNMDVIERVAFLHSLVEQTAMIPDRFILQALREETDSLAKWYLIKGLGICRSTEGIKLLTKICREPNVEFQDTSLHAICAWSLGRIGSWALKDVLELIENSTIETRRCAADALGELRDPTSVGVLCSLLENDVVEVQLWSSLSLAKIGEVSLDCLHRIALHSNMRTRILALDAILKISSSASLNILKQLLTYGSLEDKLYILENASKFYPALTEEIENLAASEEGNLARLAQQALGKTA